MMHPRLLVFFLVTIAFFLRPSVADGNETPTKPLVIHVIVPLCSNAQIDCGSPVAGKPDRLDTNLYWGALYGHRRFFERKTSDFTRVDVARGRGALLERAVYRRRIPATTFGGIEGQTIEQLVVLDAYHGDSIDQAVDNFWNRATSGGVVRFHDGETEREVRVSIVGYAGHNRLMDGIRLPPAPKDRRGAIPSFVLACASEPYFGPALRAAGSETLVMTRSLMAPEGYVLDAVVRAIGENAPPMQIRASAVKAYAQWQKLSAGAAGSIFAKPE